VKFDFLDCKKYIANVIWWQQVKLVINFMTAEFECIDECDK
jgi:hypothetical protein